MTDYRFYEWDGCDGVGRRAVLAYDHNSRPVLGAFQTLREGRWVQQPTDVAHECTSLTPEKAQERCGDVDAFGPLTGYHPGYKPGGAMTNPIAGHAYDLMALATEEQRELTLEEAGRIMLLFDRLREAYDRAWAASLSRAEPDPTSRAAAEEFWSPDGGMTTPPDDTSGDDDLGFWQRVEARLRRRR